MPSDLKPGRVDIAPAARGSHPTFEPMIRQGSMANPALGCTSNSRRTLKLLFVLVILAYERRRIVQVAVTEHPTAAWRAAVLRNAFPDHEAPAYLLHDRDAVFAAVATTIAGMNIQAVRGGEMIGASPREGLITGVPLTIDPFRLLDR